MAISCFTRLYQYYLSLFCTYLPTFFAHKVCGRLVYVSNFPFIVSGYSEIPGWYFVESLSFIHTGELQLGLEVELGSVVYFSLSELEIIDIGINSSKIVSLLKADRNLETVRALAS
jgi:hypothetical protein